MAGKWLELLKDQALSSTPPRPTIGPDHHRCPIAVRPWCGRRDLNPHGLRHQNLNLACLPIPPRPPTTKSADPPSDYRRPVPPDATGRSYIRPSPARSIAIRHNVTSAVDPGTYSPPEAPCDRTRNLPLAGPRPWIAWTGTMSGPTPVTEWGLVLWLRQPSPARQTPMSRGCSCGRSHGTERRRPA